MSSDTVVAEETPVAEQRICWICLLGNDEDGKLSWRTPCLCSGSTKWVHEKCVLKWIECSRGRSCPQCLSVYHFGYPEIGSLYKVIKKIQQSLVLFHYNVVRVGTYMTLYWILASGGAITVVQVMGVEEGLAFIRDTNAWLVLTLMPALEYTMITLQCVNWECGAVHFIELVERPINLLITYHRRCASEEDPEEAASRRNIHTNRYPPVLTTLSNTLLAPPLSVFIGKHLFNKVQNPWGRALLGFTTFLTVRIAINFYCKREQDKLLRPNRLLNRNELASQ